jgi:hypothetical protein
MKPSDTGGHLWKMLSAETEAVLRAQDDLLGSLISALDDKVGPRNYVLVVTADHGQTPLPDAVGGLRIDRFRLHAYVNERLSAEVIEPVHPDDLFLNPTIVRSEGIDPADMGRFIADVRYGDVAPEGVDLGSLPEAVVQDRVFAAALPGAYLEGLTGADIGALGRGRHPQGDLTSGVPRYARLLTS